ncbi:pickpocket protein 28-like [Toxorhynchites rutilus septentrionalis]|uniref:pickpocket protein 28-like n=1 Tax=Toxorhynchites rutilus septentrionalis TaxID=329112 RepID=UPI0024794015|nr:pickpocket protein 28-like [Toxorhynchites rutilus septentrionalis]
MSQHQWIQMYGRDFGQIIRASPQRNVETVKFAIAKEPSKWRRIRAGLRDLLVEFCSNSTIHGISYIGSRQRSMCEKFWWVFVFLLSLFGCGKLIDNIYRKWEENPVIITFDEETTPVWQIPFPAVTVCPEAKIKRDYLNFTDSFLKFAHRSSSNLTDVERQYLLSTLQICDEWFHTWPTYHHIYDKYFLKDNIVHILKRISFLADDTIYYCELNDILCKEMFTETVTEEGICMTFNGFSSRDMFWEDSLHKDYNYLAETGPAISWSLEDGYHPDADLNSYPIRVHGSGFRAGIYVHLMTTNRDLDYHCRESQGFKVSLHAPSEYPQVSSKFIRVTLGRDVTIAVKPQIVGTDPQLFGYKPERRQCYFNNERQLKFYRVYTQANCELECLTNFTLQKCGCVRFSMPRSAQTRTCETSELYCTLEAQKQLLEQNADNYIRRKAGAGTACKCLPSCNSIQYDAEITQTIFNFKETLRLRLGPIGVPYEDMIKSKQISKLEIYFKDAQFITSKRTELYGTTDFIASCGGILGLCMGVSLLSLVELLYFCSIRPLMLMKRTMERKCAIVEVKTIRMC